MISEQLRADRQSDRRDNACTGSDRPGKQWRGGGEALRHPALLPGALIHGNIVSSVIGLFDDYLIDQPFFVYMYWGPQVWAHLWKCFYFAFFFNLIQQLSLQFIITDSILSEKESLWHTWIFMSFSWVYGASPFCFNDSIYLSWRGLHMYYTNITNIIIHFRSYRAVSSDHML